MDGQSNAVRFSTEPDEVKSLVNTVIDRQYKITTQLNSSSNYFDVYLGCNIDSQQQVAIKTERSRALVLTLSNEYRALRMVHNHNKKLEGLPKVYWLGQEQSYNFLVQELLGPNLHILHRTCGKSFSLKTILMLGEQMVRRLEVLHSTGYLHRDIKPQNFCMGILGKSSVVYLANFGYVKLYKDLKSGEHRGYAENKQNPISIFSSVNSDMGMEPSRRDDLESLIYVLIYLYKGFLPWQRLEGISEEERLSKAMDLKAGMPAHILCQGLPDSLAMFLNYCKQLKYDEKPEYRHLRSLLIQAAREHDLMFDNNYDWVLINKVNEQDSRYHFRNLTISFKSAPLQSQSQMGRNSYDQPLRATVTAPEFKFKRSMRQIDSDEEDDENDNDDNEDMIPPDLGISTTSHDLSSPPKPLITNTIIRSNSAAHGKGTTLRTFPSDVEYLDRTLISEKPKLMKAMAPSLPMINDLEEERNVPEMDVGQDFLNQSGSNKAQESNFNNIFRRAMTKYNNELNEEDRKMNIKAAGQAMKFLKERMPEDYRFQTVNGNRT